MLRIVAILFLSFQILILVFYNYYSDQSPPNFVITMHILFHTVRQLFLRSTNCIRFDLNIYIMIFIISRCSNTFSSFQIIDTNEKLIKSNAINILNQKIKILNRITNEDYILKNKFIFNSSVASHIRHAINHFQSVIKSNNLHNDNHNNHNNHNNNNKDEIINYDERVRDSIIEKDKILAIEIINEIKNDISTINMKKDVIMSFMSDSECNFKEYHVHSNIGNS
jgi:hypothetical protein